MKAFGYNRVSHQDQVESGLGLEDQENKIRAYCQIRSLDLVRIYRENGVSAGIPLAERPEGAKLLKDAATEKIDVVVVLKLDRAFRNTTDCLSTVETWEKKGISLHIIDLGGNSMDTRSAAGKFMLTVLAGAAEMERNLIKERTRAALKVKRENGYKTGGRHAPYGFDQGENGKLSPNPKEQKIVEIIHKLKTKGANLREIVDALNKSKIPTKTGCLWLKSTVKNVLDSKFIVK